MFIPCHQHLLIDGVLKDPITKTKDGTKFLTDLVAVIAMKPVTKPQCVYVKEEGNEGLTGSINLATSHIAFHIWDKSRKVALDVYSCTLFNAQSVVIFSGGALGGGWEDVRAIVYNRNNHIVFCDKESLIGGYTNGDT